MLYCSADQLLPAHLVIVQEQFHTVTQKPVAASFPDQPEINTKFNHNTI